MLRRQSVPPLEGPGIYIHEVSGGSRPIASVGSSTAGFVGPQKVNVATKIATWVQNEVDKYNSERALSRCICPG